MITFALNTGYTKDKLKRVAKLIGEVNDYNKDSLTEAFLNIMEADNKGEKTNSSLNALQSIRDKHALSDKTCSKEIHFLNSDEDDSGASGLLDIADNEDFEKDILAEIDSNYYVYRFLELREKIFFDLGCDVWRLFQLTLIGDKHIKGKIYRFFEEIDETVFLWEFCCNFNHILKVKEILG